MTNVTNPLKSYTLRAPLLAQADGTTNRVASVSILDIYHYDRIAAEEFGKSDLDGQSDFLIGRMTNLPLSAVKELLIADYDALAEQYALMMGIMDDNLPTSIEAGFVHPLFAPINSSQGTLTQVKLRELTRADQRSANQFSQKSTERNAFLIARMCDLQVEDVYLMHARDTYYLESCFRAVVPAGRAATQGGHGADAGAPQPVASQHLPHDHDRILGVGAGS